MDQQSSGGRKTIDEIFVKIKIYEFYSFPKFLSHTRACLKTISIFYFLTFNSPQLRLKKLTLIASLVFYFHLQTWARFSQPSENAFPSSSDIDYALRCTAYAARSYKSSLHSINTPSIFRSRQRNSSITLSIPANHSIGSVHSRASASTLFPSPMPPTLPSLGSPVPSLQVLNLYMLRQSSPKTTLHLLHLPPQLWLLHPRRNLITSQNLVVAAHQPVAPLLPYIFTHQLRPVSQRIPPPKPLRYFISYNNHLHTCPRNINPLYKSSHNHFRHMFSNTTHHHQWLSLSTEIRH